MKGKKEEGEKKGKERREKRRGKKKEREKKTEFHRRARTRDLPLYSQPPGGTYKLYMYISQISILMT